jgi:hypothetical protein
MAALYLLPLAAIELDTSIQCRADIDTATVNEYADSMKSGDEFPPIDVYGTVQKCWIGDGWHRALAAMQTGGTGIQTTLHTGGRVDALRHALRANAIHGRRRTNADKRRSVEIALKEFPDLSSRQIAEMCGVSNVFVTAMRPEQVLTVNTSTVTGADGKQYPARRIAEDALDAHDALAAMEEAERDGTISLDELRTMLPKPGPPRNGMQFARMALMDLEQIRDDDLEREEALDHVIAWIGRMR